MNGTADRIAALAQRIIDTARQKELTLACAESFTGGGVAAALTAVPNAGEVFLAGIVAYAESAKSTLLNVDEGVIERYSAVSGLVAADMAEGIRARVDADFAVATTGYAGSRMPDEGGEAGGKYFIAVSGKKTTTVWDDVFPPDGYREQNTAKGIEQALGLLQQAVDGSIGRATNKR